jgi:transcription elongation factor GreB
MAISQCSGGLTRGRRAAAGLKIHAVQAGAAPIPFKEGGNEMSKAFTKESDDDLPTRAVVPRPASASVLPEGAKNYLTPSGARRLRDELAKLVQEERPGLAASADNEAAQRLATVDQRIYELEAILQSAEVVPLPVAAERDRVAFGATVTVRETGSGRQDRYRIVGVDEADFDRDEVSWLSPIARALIQARLGERVRFQFPSGEEELEIVGIAYE